MKVKLLRRIRDEFLREPKRLEMEAWVNTGSLLAPCGTAACIGGMALILTQAAKEGPGNLTKLKFKGVGRWINEQVLYPGSKAKKVLGLNDDQAERLFMLGMWPSEYREAYEDAEGPELRAGVAAERINHFIQTKGEE